MQYYFLFSYYRFLTNTTPTMPIAMMMAITPAIRVVIKVLVVASRGIGIGVPVDVGASATIEYVEALELPYESSPAKVAVTL